MLPHHSLVEDHGGGGGGEGGNGPGYDGSAVRGRLDPTSPQTHYTHAFLPKRARLLVRHATL